MLAHLRTVLALVGALACLGTPPAAQTGPMPRLVVRVVTTDFVLPGKIDKIARIAEARGVEVKRSDLNGSTDDLAEADLVVLDTPRLTDVAAVEKAVGDRLSATRAWLRVGGGAPAFGGLSPDTARRLAAYWAAGGSANFEGFFAYLKASRGIGRTGDVPPAVSLPRAGIHHPDAPSAFAELDAYERWATVRWAHDAPRVAVVIYPGLVSSLETATVDAIVRRSEAAGLAPVVFWPDPADPTGLETMLRRSRAEVLVVATHLQNGSSRAAEFARVGIPVIQTISHRGGGREEWMRSDKGIAPPLVAPFLAVPEGWGASDPMVVEAVENGEPAPILSQVDALVAKARRIVTLRQKPPAEKRLALLFWNYPPGEKNLAASNLNVPRSLERLTRSLADAGYDVPPTTEADLIQAGQALMGGIYRPETVADLLARDRATSVTLDRYLAWFRGLPDAVRSAVVGRWGEPDKHAAIRTVAGERVFVLPRLRLGKLDLMPQMPRSGLPGENYHDAKVPPDHLYLAQYLYVRALSGADALIHFGTHGTQEWLPGKDRGLSVHDYPWLMLGDLPVFYPYIQDNVGEAIQAKRRGRAVTISHQTPPFAPGGLYDELRDLHALVHELMQMEEGASREAAAKRLRDAVVTAKIHADMGWDEARMAADPAAFLSALHDHLHGLAEHAMPLGLHVFGEPASPDDRLVTVMQQLGRDFYAKLGAEPDEMLAVEANRLREASPLALLHRHLREGVPVDTIQDAALRGDLQRAKRLDRHLAETGETEALLAGLAGGFVAPGPGGDPIRNPDVPSGRNLFAFEPGKVPTLSAFEAGETALVQLVEAHQAAHAGAGPRKIAFSLWSSETMRHLGILEAQVLHALGLRPAWNAGGRLIGLDIVPAVELGRPRIDVVVQTTSLYRDQFDGFMRLLADAVDRLAALDEPDNPVAANSRAVAAKLASSGVAEEEARRLSTLRIFSNEPGDYGTGLSGAVLDSTAWDKDASLADAFLSRMKFAYGAKDWGLSTGSSNLFAEQLRGTDAAVLSRSSTLHGLLSTDHPFEYLGGLSLAVRRLGGASPSLYVSDLRKPTSRVASASSFLSDEMRTRTLNPHWIEGMKRQGYAGTLEVLNQVNNLFGWQVTDPGTVRADQWQAIHDTFVRDVRALGLAKWFETHNATAQAQVLDRMAEAIRKGYWDASAETRREIAQRLRELGSLGVDAGAKATREFVETMAAGYGRDAPALAAASPSEPSASAAATDLSAESVSGAVLRKVEPPSSPQVASRLREALLAIGLVSCVGLGGFGQIRANRRNAFSGALS